MQLLCLAHPFSFPTEIPVRSSDLATPCWKRALRAASRKPGRRHAQCYRIGAIEYRGCHDCAVFREGIWRSLWIAVLLRTCRKLRQVQEACFFERQFECEIRGESRIVPLHLLVESSGCDTVNARQIMIEYHPATSQKLDSAGDIVIGRQIRLEASSHCVTRYRRRSGSTPFHRHAGLARNGTCFSPFVRQAAGRCPSPTRHPARRGKTSPAA